MGSGAGQLCFKSQIAIAAHENALAAAIYPDLPSTSKQVALSVGLRLVALVGVASMSKTSTDPRQPWLMWIESVLKDPRASNRLAWLCAALIVAYAHLLTQAGQESFGFPSGRDAREVQRERQREKRLRTFAEALGLPAPTSEFQLPTNEKWDLEAWLAHAMDQSLDATSLSADPVARASVAEALRLTFDLKDVDLRFLIREQGQLSFWDQVKTWEDECRSPSWSVAALCEYAVQKQLPWRTELSLWSLRHSLALQLVAEVVDQSPTEKLRQARLWVAQLRSQDFRDPGNQEDVRSSSLGPEAWTSSWSQVEILEARLRLEWKLGLARDETARPVRIDSTAHNNFASWAERRRSEIQSQRRTWSVRSGLGDADSQFVASELAVWAGCESVTAAKLARIKSRYLVWVHGREGVGQCETKSWNRTAQHSSRQVQSRELRESQPRIVLPAARARWAWSVEEEMRHQVKELAKLNPRLKLTVVNLDALRLAMHQGLLSPTQTQKIDAQALTLSELQELHPLLRPQSVSELSHGLLAVKSPLPLVVVMSQISAI
jgi:hypothetical protein